MGKIKDNKNVRCKMSISDLITINNKISYWEKLLPAIMNEDKKLLKALAKY